MPALVWIGIFLGIGYLLGIASVPRVLLQRRESTATLAWLLAIVLLPYAGIVAFLLFGGRRVQRVKRKRLKALSPIQPTLDQETADRLQAFHRQPSTPRVEHALEAAMSIARRLTNEGATTGNRVDLLVDADPTFAAMEAAIRGARDHVHLLSYIFRGDTIGTRFRDCLIERARAGVEVRLLYDHVGSFSLPSSFLEPLVAAGGKVDAFLPVNPLARRFGTHLRNHRKILVVDGRVGFTGGINIGDEYATGGLRKRRWRDTHARIEGPAVLRLQEVFAEDWAFSSGEDLHGDRYFPVPVAAGPELVQVLSSGPDSRWEVIHRIYFAAITQARHSVLLTTPYFIPDFALQVALETAALRGVDVRILIPRRCDHRILDYASRSFLPDLVRAGVRVYEYGPGMMHAKTAVIDGIWSSVGSANMDIRSFRLNFETNFAVYGEEFAVRLSEVIERDIASARELRLQTLLSAPRRQRLLEGAGRLLAPVL